MEVCYPLFLQPGKLRALNELAFREVGFPLFLYVSERPALPRRMWSACFMKW